jgi:small subunit ribosomal protein S18
MSEEMNPTPEAILLPTTPAEPTTAAEPVAAPVAPPPVAPPVAPPPPVAEAASRATNVAGPGDYVPEPGGRQRRTSIDVRLEDINYKNVTLLSRFLDQRGRILSRRKTRVSAKAQRLVVQAIKHARHLALLPYTSDQTRIVRRRR